MAAKTPNPSGTSFIFFSPDTQQAILDFCKQTVEFSRDTFDIRNALASIDIEYYRENQRVQESLLARGANALGDKRRIQDLVVPIVEPQVETQLAYLTSVFLSGNPIFALVADPDNQEPAKAFEAIIDSQAKKGAWIREFMMFFRDGLKYNLHALEVDWCRTKTYDISSAVSSSGLKAEATQVIWEGNKIKRMDLYNTFFDIRVAPAEQHSKAEFVGYVELFSRIALKKYLMELENSTNHKEAFQSSLSTMNRYYIPQINFNALINNQSIVQGMDWMKWARGQNQQTIEYKNIYEVIVRYCRIIPSDFNMNVPAKNTPQIWKFITVNDQVLVYWERLTNAHDFLPIIFGQPIEDGLDYQTKSFASRLIPLQDTASALWNARLAAKRRSVSDRGLYDPSRVREADINSDNPSAKIPVRSAAYGKPLQEAYFPIPFRDEQSSSFVQDAREMMQFANFVSGQNQAQQGQFVKGNKTLQEFDEIMGHSSGRQRMTAQFIEDQTMTPIKEIIKLNILQYQPAGEIYHAVDNKSYNYDPVALRQMALQFKVADGLIPVDKIVDPQTLIMALQTVQAVPQLQMGYNVPKMFSYLMSLKNLDLKPFELNQQEVQARQQEMINAQASVAGKSAAAETAGQNVANRALPPPLQAVQG